MTTIERPVAVATAQPSASASRTVVLRLTARRAARSGAGWGLVFAVFVAASANGYLAAYPTNAERVRLATSLSANAGVAAILGPVRHLETVAGFVSWRAMGALSLVGAVWGMLAGTRLTRGEEDAGRWELLLSGRVTRGGAAGQALLALAVGWACLWAVTSAAILLVGRRGSVGFGVGDSLFFATALVSSAAMFLAVGALAAQLAASRRQANLAAAAVLGASYLLRMVADSSAGLDWLRWTNPLGWPEELRPLTQPRSLGFAPIAALTIVAAVAARLVAGRRDLGAAALPARDEARGQVRRLTGVLGLTVRLNRAVVASWLVGLAALGTVLGLVAQSAAEAITGNATVARILARLGGHRSGAESYLGFAFLIAATLVAFAAAAQLTATRVEEADGLVDHLLVRPVGRLRWLAARLGVAVTLVVLAGLTVAAAAWTGAASQHSDVAARDLLEAGLNVAVPALVVVGVGTLVLGLRPRWTAVACYGLVAWSFLLEIVSSSLTLNHWVVDTSLLHHLAPAPAANPNWTTNGWLLLLAAGTTAVGMLRFRGRDLEGT